MKTGLYLLSGLVLGAAAALVLSLAVVNLNAVPSQSGGREMEIIFAWMPIGAVLGLIAGLILRLRR